MRWSVGAGDRPAVAAERRRRSGWSVDAGDGPRSRRPGDGGGLGGLLAPVTDLLSPPSDGGGLGGLLTPVTDLLTPPNGGGGLGGLLAPVTDVLTPPSGRWRSARPGPTSCSQRPGRRRRARRPGAALARPAIGGGAPTSSAPRIADLAPSNPGPGSIDMHATTGAGGPGGGASIGTGPWGSARRDARPSRPPPRRGGMSQSPEAAAPAIPRNPQPPQAPRPPRPCGYCKQRRWLRRGRSASSWLCSSRSQRSRCSTTAACASRRRSGGVWRSSPSSSGLASPSGDLTRTSGRR